MKLKVTWTETVTRESVLEIPIPYDGSPQADAHVENQVRKFQADHPLIGYSYLEYLSVEDVEALRSKSKAEVG